MSESRSQTTESSRRNQIIIYSQTAHLIQHYPSNTTTINLPKSTNLDSIVILTGTGKSVAFSIHPAITDYTSEIQVHKDSKIFTGTLIKSDSNSVTIITNETAGYRKASIASELITIRNYDQISMKIQDHSAHSAHPRLSCQIN